MRPKKLRKLSELSETLQNTEKTFPSLAAETFPRTFPSWGKFGKVAQLFKQHADRCTDESAPSGMKCMKFCCSRELRQRGTHTQLSFVHQAKVCGSPRRSASAYQDMSGCKGLDASALCGSLAFDSMGHHHQLGQKESTTGPCRSIRSRGFAYLSLQVYRCRTHESDTDGSPPTLRPVAFHHRRR